MTNTKIARVLLDRTIQKSSAIFDYSIPDKLQNELHIGQLVWVPLKNTLVQGLVLEINRATKPYKHAYYKDIESLVEPAIHISPIGMQLAQLVAQSTFSPLYTIIRMMLPHGITRELVRIWYATTDGLHADLATLPEYERSILYYLRKHGKTAESTLNSILQGNKEKIQDTYALLAGHGLIASSMQQKKPSVKAQTERIVTLCIAPEETTPTIKETLKRSSRQQAIVEWLASQRQKHLEADETETDFASTEQYWRSKEIAHATGATLAHLRALEKKGIIAMETRQVRRNPLAGTDIPPDNPPVLTAAQRHVWDPIAHALDKMMPKQNPHPSSDTNHTIFLLHGVTGSGKTEIYLRSVARVLRMGLQALVLVPEIALTTQLVRRFAARFPGKLAVLHSKLSEGERYDEWWRIYSGETPLIIGSRSALFAPLSQPGLIIVDEEHEPSYKQDSVPRYHARHIAIELGKIAGSVVILGSATPSVESYYTARSGTYTLLRMTERIGSYIGSDGLPNTQVLPLPRVELVDMRRELQQENRSIFSHSLQHALTTALQNQEQTILFINRRGAASFVMCRDCGYVAKCPACDSPLVMHYEEQSLHKTQRHRTPASLESPDSILVCHTCNYRLLVPAFCPECLSTRIKSFGIGTQRVVQEVETLFPYARALRWDRDSVTSKGSYNRLFDQFLNHEADILVGTQMIAKGLDLPYVSVVGVVAADIGLYMPDFRNGERTFQLLTQVAGRAGRRKAGANVVIQTYTPEHYALQAAQEHDYDSFYMQEIAFRRQAIYPPYSRFIRFMTVDKNRTLCEKRAQSLEEAIQTLIQRANLYNWGIVGPAPSFFQRQRGFWRWHLLVRIPATTDISQLQWFYESLQPLYGWTIDVDPMNVL